VDGFGVSWLAARQGITGREPLGLVMLKNTKGLAGNTVAMKIRDGTFIIEPA
jgi:hypothetical protein